MFTLAKLFIRTFINDEKGQGMAEYALILAGVAVAVIAAVFLLGDGIEGLFGDVTTGINTGTAPTEPTQ